MTVKELIEDYGYEDIVVFENPSYEEAFIGISHDDRAVYDFEKMAECLMREDGMAYDEAVEFIEYNTIRALPYTANAPIVVNMLSE